MIGRATVQHVQPSKALSARDNDQTTKALMLISLATPGRKLHSEESEFLLNELYDSLA